MKNKVKEFIKSYLPGFILGVISAAVVVVYAETYFPSNQVTYDNTESGLSSSNVQGAIDELYGVCFPPSAGDQIIEDGGLEKDPYECRYFFTGANPNNYVTFNGETASWRIISVECDGSVKIMKTAKIGIMAWDSSNLSNWARPASLNTYLNGTYLNSLSSEAQGQIVAKDFSIGVISRNNNDLADQVNDENSKTWNGKIALPTLSEYLRTNSNVNCKTYQLYDSNYSTCKNTSWISFGKESWRLLTTEGYSVFYISYTGELSYLGANNSGFSIVPTFYLSPEIQITGGDGTQNNPYTIN